MSSVSPCRTIGWSSTTSTRCLPRGRAGRPRCAPSLALSLAYLAMGNRQSTMVPVPCTVSHLTSSEPPIMLGAVAHDVQAHARLAFGGIASMPTPSSSIASRPVLAERRQRDHDPLRAAVLDGVADRFLRDVKEVRRGRDVVEQHRRVTRRTGTRRETDPRPRRQSAAGRPSGRRRRTRPGTRPRDSSRVFSIASLTRRHDLAGVGGLGQRTLLETLLQHLAHEGGAGQVLPEAIVQILTDAPLLAAADSRAAPPRGACAR